MDTTRDTLRARWTRAVVTERDTLARALNGWNAPTSWLSTEARTDAVALIRAGGTDAEREARIRAVSRCIAETHGVRALGAVADAYHAMHAASGLQRHYRVNGGRADTLRGAHQHRNAFALTELVAASESAYALAVSRAGGRTEAERADAMVWARAATGAECWADNEARQHGHADALEAIYGDSAEANPIRDAMERTRRSAAILAEHADTLSAVIRTADVLNERIGTRQREALEAFRTWRPLHERADMTADMRADMRADVLADVLADAERARSALRAAYAAVRDAEAERDAWTGAVAEAERRYLGASEADGHAWRDVMLALTGAGIP